MLLQDVTCPENAEVSNKPGREISDKQKVNETSENSCLDNEENDDNSYSYSTNTYDLELSLSGCSDSCSLLSPPYSPIVYSSTDDDEGDDGGNENLSDMSVFNDIFSTSTTSILFNPPVNLPTFKLVIDNLDIFVRPRTETSQRHADSLHFVHMYAE